MEFRCIVAFNTYYVISRLVSIIGGGNRSAQIKITDLLPGCPKSLADFPTCTPAEIRTRVTAVGDVSGHKAGAFRPLVRGGPSPPMGHL